MDFLLNEIDQQAKDRYKVTNSGLHQYGLFIIAIIMCCIIIHVILKKITLFYKTEENIISIRNVNRSIRARNNKI